MRVPAPSGIRPNGMAVAALVLGTAGTVFGFMPPTGFIAVVCGVLAIALGYIGIRRAQRGAEHWEMAVAGVLLGVAARTCHRGEFRFDPRECG